MFPRASKEIVSATRVHGISHSRSNSLKLLVEVRGVKLDTSRPSLLFGGGRAGGRTLVPGRLRARAFPIPPHQRWW